MIHRYIYYRCSTAAQDFAQQEEVIRAYFARQGLDMTSVAEAVKEKISGTVSFEGRQLAALLNRAESGDIIYISELSRLGRNMTDVFNFVDRAARRGVALVQCKDSTQIEGESTGGKAILFALSLAAEIEVANIRQRTAAGLAARREALEARGSFLSKSGRKCTHFGREKGADTGAARAASAAARAAAAMRWRETTRGVGWALERYREGVSRAEIVRQYNEYMSVGAPGFVTRSGGPLTAAVLGKWINKKF